jgi:antitoxin component YwqK of YwqJK toxin-antitoxin module
MKETYDEISKVTLSCPPGASQIIERWSKGGYSVSCRANDVKDGPWQAWEGGHLSISGAYAKGKEHGTWLVYTDKGKQLYRTITYENGKEVSNVVH